MQGKLPGLEQAVVFCIDEVRRQFLFMRALKSYAMLNEEREPILARIVAELRR